MAETKTPPDKDQWVLGYKAIRYIQNQGFEAFTLGTLKHYAYDTDLLPKPKIVGRRAYYRISDLDKLIEAL